MEKRKFHFFIGCVVLSFFLLHAMFRWQVGQQRELYSGEIHILQSDMEERFKLLIDSPLAIGLVSAEYFSRGEVSQKEYQKFAANIIHSFNEILGVNYLDPSGKISRVFPLEENKEALGKITQNMPELVKSLNVGDAFWLSPPFKLFQHPAGFGFYIPMYKDDQFLGWTATIISVDRFFRKFIKSEYLESYHLVIQDKLTGNAYFKSTSNLPKDLNEVMKHSTVIKGREMLFMSWRKQGPIQASVHWPLVLGCSLLVSILATIAFWFFEQKIKAKNQLRKIEALLKLTIVDTGTSLGIIRGQLDLMKIGSGVIPLEKATKHVAYISTLLEQIKFLQKVSNPDEYYGLPSRVILDLVSELNDRLKEKFDDKKLSFHYDSSSLEKVEIPGNYFLLFQSILGNILGYSIYNAATGTDVNFIYQADKGFHLFIVTNKGPGLSEDVLSGKQIPHELFIARKVLDLYKAELTLKNDTSGGSVFLIKLPT